MYSLYMYIFGIVIVSYVSNVFQFLLNNNKECCKSYLNVAEFVFLFMHDFFYRYLTQTVLLVKVKT